MKKTLFTLIALAFTTLSFAETVKIHVPGMVCQMCVQGMQQQFKSLVTDKEKDILVDLDAKIVTVVTIDPITDDEIKERVNDAGYNAKFIERVKK